MAPNEILKECLVIFDDDIDESYAPQLPVIQSLALSGGGGGGGGGN